MAFAARNDSSKNSNLTNPGHVKGQRKDKALCTHCNYHGHTVDKCYKLHGYRPGYKSKPRFPSAQAAQANQFSATNQISDDSKDHNCHNVENSSAISMLISANN